MKQNLTLTLAAIALSLSSVVADEISLQSAPPVVVRTVPVAGAADVDPALTEIHVTYSKPMQDGNWSWSTWGEENYPETTGNPHYLPDGRTCVLPVKLQPDKFYAIWLNSDKFKNFKDTDLRPAVPYLLTFSTGKAGGLSERLINKRVSEFPQRTDLSTPETAWAAWQRATVAKDAKAISQLSLVPIDVEEEEAWFKREQKRYAKGFEVYLKALAESKVVAVQLWKGELASVISELAFPPGQGSAPFSSRTYGLINGEWKNLGEDRLPTLDAARANFEQKKANIWEQYVTLRDARQSGGKREAEESQLSERLINKRVSEFPQRTDLSTPESACAAWQRANAAKDAKAISQLSLVPIDVAEEEAWFKREQKRDAKGLDTYLKAVAESKIVLVQVWKGELANVISELPFPSGKGSAPFSSRTFGLINGQWKNLGEDRLPTLDAARANFEQKKANIWEQYVTLRDARQSGGKREAEESQRGPVKVISEKIQTEVRRQLEAEGAHCDELKVSVAEMRDSATPFQVVYRGLRGLQASPEVPVNGDFRMEYIGAGKWQGTLGNKTFTVPVGRTDDINLPFVNDPAVLGAWESVDFVSRIGDFDPDKRNWEGELFLKQVNFLENGKTKQPWWTWTKGFLIHRGDQTASRYEIRRIKGQAYLFLEWKSGDVTILGREPAYYVLKNVQAAGASTGNSAWEQLLNADQRAVIEWTDRQFRSYFDRRTFDGWSDKERADLEAKLLDTLKGPENREYYVAINTLAALRTPKAAAGLREIAFSRLDKNNRDRWMAIRGLGLMGDKSAVPDLIHLVYHGNQNTHWWAQISLVRLTGQNFGTNWNAWGNWWNQSGGQPPFKPEIIRWWAGQPEPDKLAETLAEGDRKFLAELNPSQTNAASPMPSEPEAVPDLPKAAVLHYDNGIQKGFESIAASGHAVWFERWADTDIKLGRKFRTLLPGYLEAVQIYASRYGAPEPPNEDFHLYILNEKEQVLADIPFPYSMIERGEMRWYTLRTPSIEVPEKFMVALNFNPHRTKGIYLAYSATNGIACQSLIGLPGEGFERFREPVEWMVRVSLTEQPTKAKGLQTLADWKPPVTQDVFVGSRVVSFGGDKSEGKQSYGGSGPALRFKPAELLPDMKKGQPALLKGVRLYASRYGSGYSLDETKLKVTVMGAQTNVLTEASFAYGRFNFKEHWVDLAFEQPLKIQNPGELLTIAFDPEATGSKGIYFHYQKSPAASHSLAGTVTKGFKELPDREWMACAVFEP